MRIPIEVTIRIKCHHPFIQMGEVKHDESVEWSFVAQNEQELSMLAKEVAESYYAIMERK
jgi:hypothetical protein